MTDCHNPGAITGVVRAPVGDANEPRKNAPGPLRGDTNERVVVADMSGDTRSAPVAGVELAVVVGDS